jgi:peptidoglycan/LPS O-acetylase OafA/YrhL
MKRDTDESNVEPLGNSPKIRNAGYRPEIDGLRAFAVTAVIINHFNENVLTGGYLGVDIFFVISGYVITSSLSSRKSHSFGNFLLSFYERRIRRLLPALLVCIVVTSVLLCLFNPDPGVSLGVGWRALFGWSNISLYTSATDYFAEATELNPFTHTWSLGVEEQFYLLFPFLFWFTGFGRNTRNGARNLLLWIGALALTSTVAFSWLYGMNRPMVYFLMPFRFWEMAAGCLVFLCLRNGGGITEWTQRIPPLLLLAGITGLMLHPMGNGAVATIAVVLLTALSMTCLRPGTWTYAAFTSRRVVRIGLISYSLYLWHWSVLSLSRWTVGIHWWTVPFQLILIVLIANASYRWVECPLRSQHSNRRAWVLATGALAMVLGSLTTVAVGRAGLYSGTGTSERRGSGAEARTSSEDTIGCNLFENPKDAKTISGSCKSSPFVGRPTLYAFGDSHMSQFGKALKAFATEKQLNQAMVTGNGCLFPAAVIRGESLNCYERQKAVEMTIRHVIRRGDIVFIGNALYAGFYPGWGQARADYKDHAGGKIDTRTAAKMYSQHVQALSKELNQLGATVVLYIDSVQFPEMERLPGTLCREEWFRPAALINRACTQSLRAHLKQIDQDFSWRHAWSNGVNRIAWNAYHYRKDCDGDRCRANSYHDSNHFNEGYASEVFTSFIADHPSLLKAVNHD